MENPEVLRGTLGASWVKKKGASYARRSFACIEGASGVLRYANEHQMSSALYRSLKKVLLMLEGASPARRVLQGLFRQMNATLYISPCTSASCVRLNDHE